MKHYNSNILLLIIEQIMNVISYNIRMFHEFNDNIIHFDNKL